MYSAWQGLSRAGGRAGIEAARVKNASEETLTVSHMVAFPREKEWTSRRGQRSGARVKGIRRTEIRHLILLTKDCRNRLTDTESRPWLPRGCGGVREGWTVNLGLVGTSDYISNGWTATCPAQRTIFDVLG